MSRTVTFSARNATLATLHLEGGEGDKNLQDTAAYLMACFLSVGWGTEVCWYYEGSVDWVVDPHDALAEMERRFEK